MEMKKIQVKIRDDQGVERWVHFCYVPQEIYEEFEDEINTLNAPVNNWVLKWAAEDFEITEFNLFDDLTYLQQCIKSMYRNKYPELYLDSETDRQGWVRVWYTQHMEEELKGVTG